MLEDEMKEFLKQQLGEMLIMVSDNTIALTFRFLIEILSKVKDIPADHSRDDLINFLIGGCLAVLETVEKKGPDETIDKSSLDSSKN